ncbi:MULTISPECIES: hypothetical protein [unclassified Bradyrhizobium]|uniref:hypothetical protein n=1 Tax=unclassified Bradyrhizobium TaxID=2631580 RepID=UPI00247A4D21|nr:MULTISPECIES: hypothetical protein [unclassified Bradyrhizobium]WGS20563.1 hypothetical protein MTX22_01630 [Bradyrhizobium sp. ISRA463]WGS27449.1 hypothetical protein MTX19_38510 [Bradyrhizobium sp. ISRA464]
MVINVVLAIFNILVGILPRGLATPVARPEPYGMVIPIGLLIVLPLLGAQLGLGPNAVSHVLASSADRTISEILRVTRNA